MFSLQLLCNVIVQEVRLICTTEQYHPFRAVRFGLELHTETPRVHIDRSEVAEDARPTQHVFGNRCPTNSDRASRFALRLLFTDEQRRSAAAAAAPALLSGANPLVSRTNYFCTVWPFTARLAGITTAAHILSRLPTDHVFLSMSRGHSGR